MLPKPISILRQNRAPIAMILGTCKYELRDDAYLVTDDKVTNMALLYKRCLEVLDQLSVKEPLKVVKYCLREYADRKPWIFKSVVKLHIMA